jgi:sarcosine oxidase subunit beta
VDPGYTPVGYLWLACNDRHLELLRCARVIQHQHGLAEARELGIAEAATLNPHVSMDAIMGAAFCPTDGYIEPVAILRGYREAGERLGVNYRWNSEVTSIDAGGDRVRLGTSDGDLNADIVVNAAGPWAGIITAMAGVDLPITPVRRQAAVTQPAPHISPSMPMTIYMDTGFHLRARDGRAVLCWPTDAPNPEDPTPVADDYWVEAVRVMIDQRVPALRAVGLDRQRCYSGLYEMSPDKHAIVGFAPECPKMFLVNGSSGHGVMHSPALGAAAADIISGRAPAIDLSTLNPGRFAAGEFLEAGLL